MKSHKPGISSLPMASPTLRAAACVSQPCLFSRQVNCLPKGQSFCTHADIYWNSLLHHLPIEPTNQTESSPRAADSTSPQLLGLCPEVQFTGQQHWDDGLRWFLESNQLLGERAGNKALDQAQAGDAEEAFLAWLKVCWRDVAREQTRVKRFFWVWEAGGGDIMF